MHEQWVMTFIYSALEIQYTNTMYIIQYTFLVEIEGKILTAQNCLSFTPFFLLSSFFDYDKWYFKMSKSSY